MRGWLIVSDPACLWMVDIDININIHLSGICNWIGVRDVMSSLPSYAHQEAFNDLDYTPWTPFVGEGRKGAYKCFSNAESSDGMLCYLEMDGAGHMVAHDKPREANTLVSNWMKNRALG